MNPSAVDLRLLRSFIAAARLASVTKAADALHLTQPALSQHLRELSTLVGVPLFDRVGRGVALTPAGADLLRELEPLLLHLDSVLTSLKATSREVRGTLRVGAIDTYARALVIPTVAQVLAGHPQLNVVIDELPAAAIDRGLLEGELDIGVAFSHLSNADIEQETLFEENLMLIYRTNARRRMRGPVSLSDVATRRLALLNQGFAMRRQIDTAFARAELALDVRVEAANVDSLMRLAEYGQFATIASRLALREGSDLEVRPIAHADLTRIAAIRRRRGRTLSPAVQTFVASLKERILQVK
jgi:LysR family transcriptional regulator, cyn operon transcriptional activator